MPAAEVLSHPAIPGIALAQVRTDFPILRRTVHGRPLVYLDNAASTQKPRQVIDVTSHFYEAEYSNIHRGVHHLSYLASEAYEGSRLKVRDFIHARSEREIIFVRGATEGINLVASSFGRKFLKPGDEILLSAMEHHSNIVPWQMLCEETGARLRVIPMSDEGELMQDEYARLLSERTRLVGLVHVSNALGTINPVGDMIQLAHRVGAKVLIDGAQSIPHLEIDVQELDCDFFVFSGHKIYGPSGVGVLYGKEELLEAMPPYQGGGDMIRSVTFEKTSYNTLPYKFEAGTPNIAGVVGLGAALDYVTGIGLGRIERHERELLDYGTRALAQVPGLRPVGTAREKAGVLSFIFENIHPHDIGTVLDREGIAIRTGHHCAQPVMDRLGIPATARASLALYNTAEEIDALVEGLHKVIEVFA